MKQRLLQYSGLALATAFFAGCSLATASAVQDSMATPESDNVVTTDMGAICWAAIVEAGYQVTSRCDLGDRSASKETVAAYERSRNDLSERFMEFGWSQERLNAFRSQQGNADVPTDELCALNAADNDTAAFLIGLAQANPSSIEATTKAVLAQPGEPRWGTCL